MAKGKRGPCPYCGCGFTVTVNKKKVPLHRVDCPEVNPFTSLAEYLKTVLAAN